MIERKLVQDIQWVDIDHNILNENTVLEWRLFGKFLIRRRVVIVKQLLPEDHTNRSTPGFKS